MNADPLFVLTITPTRQRRPQSTLFVKFVRFGCELIILRADGARDRAAARAHTLSAAKDSRRDSR